MYKKFLNSPYKILRRQDATKKNILEGEVSE